MLHWYKNLIIFEWPIPKVDKQFIGNKIAPDNQFMFKIVSEDSIHVYIDPELYTLLGGKSQLRAYIALALTFAKNLQ